MTVESMTEAGKILGIIFIAIMQVFTRKTVTEVKKVAEVTKVLVDGSLSSELQISATSARTLAELTKKHEHVLLADQAELRLKEHMAKMHEATIKENHK